MTTYEVGSTITVAIKVYDSTGALANVGGTMTCTAVKPDGTTATATVTNPSTGTYQATLVSTLAGRYRFPFVGTGTNSGGTPWTAVADVWPTDPRLIISLDDARASLNFPSTTVVNDDELRLFIAAATEVIEFLAGPVLNQTRTWSCDGGSDAVLIPDEMTAVTSVVSNGVTLTAGTQYVTNLRSGIVYSGSSTSTSGSTFTPGRQTVVVTYTVGNGTVKPNVVLAARELVRNWFQWGQQGGPRPGFGEASDYGSTTVLGYDVPPRVLTLLEPENPMPGFA